jgi:ABC-type Fe3+-siderophore transport system permease subunit
VSTTTVSPATAPRQVVRASASVESSRTWTLSRRQVATGVLTLAGVVVFAVSVGVAITLGPADVSLVNVRDILLNHLAGAEIPVRASEDAIVWQERLPRALVAAACGSGLGLCGAILQSLLRNPLADPFVLGVSSGGQKHPGTVLLPKEPGIDLAAMVGASRVRVNQAIAGFREQGYLTNDNGNRITDHKLEALANYCQ